VVGRRPGGAAALDAPPGPSFGCCCCAGCSTGPERRLPRPGAAAASLALPTVPEARLLASSAGPRFTPCPLPRPRLAPRRVLRCAWPPSRPGAVLEHSAAAPILAHSRGPDCRATGAPGLRPAPRAQRRTERSPGQQHPKLGRGGGYQGTAAEALTRGAHQRRGGGTRARRQPSLGPVEDHQSTAAEPRARGGSHGATAGIPRPLPLKSGCRANPRSRVGLPPAGPACYLGFIRPNIPTI
jgi:hypothetical protein